MCGITGIYHRDGRPVARALLKRMADTIQHRGPDDEGYYTDGPVGFGHRRLAIIDLSPTGRQPMGNETGDISLIYNGELFNFTKLRAELRAAGHLFVSQSDTEVIIHAYEEWGEACVERFNGQFAFALWDGPRRKLFLARDRFGVKPLYYYVDSSMVVFGSEMKAILTHPDVKPTICYPALTQYFTFQNIFTDETLIDNIRLLPAGCTLTIDPKNTLVQHRYWDYCFARQPLNISFDEAAEELHRLFEQGVTRQLMSDVPVASYLSGGMDSGSITAVARHSLGRLMTFTCGFDLSSASGLELGFDERAKAEVLANLLKTEHYEVVLHAGDMEHVMPELIWHLEDLRVGQSYPNYYIARLASKFVKVVMSGTGGDELFAGYPWRYFRGMNSTGRQDFSQNYYNFWQRLVPDDERVQLFNDSTYRQVQDISNFEIFQNVLKPFDLPMETNADFINASLYFELKTFLHGLLLVEDKLSMAHSLESRVPFLDNDLVDFALQLPAHYKLRNLDQPFQGMDENEVSKVQRYELQTDDGKAILRKAMSKFIPTEVAGRVKQGFSAPDATWFRGESIDYINTLLRDPHARLYEFVNPDYVVRKLDEHTSGQHNNRLFIWSLLSFEWWMRRFMV